MLDYFSIVYTTSGIYLLLSVLALGLIFQFRPNQNRLPKLHFGLALFSAIYCHISIWAVSGSFQPEKLAGASLILFALGFLSQILYLNAIDEIIGPAKRWTRSASILIFVLGLVGSTMLLFCLVTEDLSLFYVKGSSLPINTFLGNYLGDHVPRPETAGLLFGSVGSLIFFSYLVTLIRIARSGRREYLLFLGSLVSAGANINDIFFGTGGFQNIYPLAFCGFLLEGIRFHLHLQRDRVQELSRLQSQVFHLAQSSEKGRVASHFVHDLKNLLVSIRSRTINEEVVKSLFEQLNEVSRYYLAKLQLKASDSPRNFITRKNLENSLSILFSPELKELEAKLILKGEVDKALPLAEPEALVVFGNLIRNAIDAYKSSYDFKKVLAKKLIIEIQLEENHNGLVIFVSDSGPGIPKPIRSNLFSSNPQPPIGGRHLGLGIVREIVMENQGLLTLDSPENPTRFRIEFSKISTSSESNRSPHL